MLGGCLVTSAAEISVGIDVARLRLDVAVPTPARQTLDNKLAPTVPADPGRRARAAWRRRRGIWAGRAHVRAVLDMATLAATHGHPPIRAFCRRVAPGRGTATAKRGAR